MMKWMSLWSGDGRSRHEIESFWNLLFWATAWRRWWIIVDGWKKIWKKNSKQVWVWTTAVLASTHTHPYSPSHSLSPLPLLTLSLFRSPPRIFIHLTVFIVFCLCLRCLLTLFRQFFLSKKTNADAAAAAAYFLCCAFQGYYSKAGSPVLAFLLANVLIWEGHFIKRAESVSARERERERESAAKKKG